MGSGEHWAAILAAIRSPQVLLGWFALVLGVVAIAVIATAGLNETAKLLVLGGLGALFLILIVSTVVITFFRPAHLGEQLAAVRETLDSDAFTDMIRDMVREELHSAGPESG
ncbi:MAG: hypothetical protein OXU67_12585 [Chloroflexota bacterium]|nr:hypothetical protein [Chloroflexota bacterium]